MKRFLDNLAVASIDRQTNGKTFSKILIYFQIRVAVIFAWDVEFTVIVVKRTSAE